MHKFNTVSTSFAFTRLISPPTKKRNLKQWNKKNNLSDFFFFPRTIYKKKKWNKKSEEQEKKAGVLFLSVRLVQPLRRRHVSSRRASLDHVGNFLNNSEKRNKLWARLVEKLRQSHYSSLNKIQVSQTLDGLFVCFLNILRSDLNASLLVFFSIHPNEKKKKTKQNKKTQDALFPPSLS